MTGHLSAEQAQWNVNNGRVGKKFQPANGTEGDYFMHWYCFRCQRDASYQETGEGQGCRILLNTMVYDTNDDEYPAEWVIGADGQPTCTAFVPLEEQPQEGPKSPRQGTNGLEAVAGMGKQQERK